MTTRRIVIPTEIINDRPTRRMLGEWKKLHADFRLCQKRVWHGARKSSEIEKARRKKQWKYLARILEIESYLISWCASLTHHPDIWTKKTMPRAASVDQMKQMKSHTNASQRLSLIVAYYKSRRDCRALSGRGRAARRQSMRADQRALVIQIRGLERLWMIAMFDATHPGESPPAPLKLSTIELRPRKVKAAVHDLQQEVA